MANVTFADNIVFSETYIKPSIGFVKPLAKTIPNFGAIPLNSTAESLAKRASNSTMFGVAIGSKVASNFRAELELAQRGNFNNNISKQTGLFSITGLGSSLRTQELSSLEHLDATLNGMWLLALGTPEHTESFPQNDPLDFSLNSKIKATSLMANGYYDFNINSDLFTPFIGFGIGISKIKAIINPMVKDGDQTINVSVISAAYPYDPYVPLDWKQEIKKTKFSYSLAAGTSIKLSEKITAELKLQYVELGKIYGAVVGSNTPRIIGGGEDGFTPFTISPLLTRYNSKAIEVLLGVRMDL